MTLFTASPETLSLASVILPCATVASRPYSRTMCDEDRIRLDALSEEDLSYIASSEKYSQLLREQLPDKEAPASIDPSGESVDSAPRSTPPATEADHPGRRELSKDHIQPGADPTTARNTHIPSSLNPDQVVRGGQTQAEETSLSGDEDVTPEGPLPKRLRLEGEAGPSSLGVEFEYLFDPVMAGTEEDEYHFTPPEVVSNYLE